MLVYRISKKEYIHDLTGIGAALHGGRWNPKGLNLLYTAGNIALAYVEYLIHNYHLLKSIHVCMATIEVPGDIDVAEILVDELPKDWQDKDKHLSFTREIGKRFIQTGAFYMLKAPSAAVPGEFNYLINPAHTEHRHARIRELIDPLTYDQRLWK